MHNVLTNFQSFDSSMQKIRLISDSIYVFKSLRDVNPMVNKCQCLTKENKYIMFSESNLTVIQKNYFLHSKVIFILQT
jgi:hypothetical protein